VLALALALTACGTAGATEGSMLSGIGAPQKGTAGAGVASPEDSTWTLLNPAAIVDLERRVDLGADLLMPERSVEVDGPSAVVNTQVQGQRFVLSLANPDAGEMRDRSSVWSPVLGFVTPYKDVSVGFGVFGAQGNHVSYPRSRSLQGRDNGDLDRRAQLEVVKVPLALAHRFDNGWSAGVALVGVVARLRTDALTLGLLPTQGRYDWDTALGIGLRVGVYRRWERFSVGAAYLTPQVMTDFNEYQDLMRYNLDMPQELQAGIAWRPVDWAELLLDYRYINWAGVPQVAEVTVLGGLGWEDQHLVKAGVRLHAGKRWTFRAGVSHGNAPIEREDVFSNVLFPAIIETHVTAGITARLGKRMQHELHVAYMHAFENELTDSGRGDVFSVAGAGTRISLRQNAVALQYSYRF
jgi:long-chain fatty acid transport protein